MVPFRGGLGERRATTNSHTASRHAAAVSIAVTLLDLGGIKANNGAKETTKGTRLIAA